MTPSEYVFVQFLEAIIRFALGTVIVLALATGIIGVFHLAFTFVGLRKLQEYEVLRALQQLVMESHGEPVPQLRLCARLDATATPNWTWRRIDRLVLKLERKGLIGTAVYTDISGEQEICMELLDAGYQLLNPDFPTDDQIRTAVDP